MAYDKKEKTDSQDKDAAKFDPDGTLAMLKKWQAESQDNRTSYEYRWAKNIRLVKGLFDDAEMARSKVRGRSKLFFRKIWSNNIRLLASFQAAFLRDLDSQFRVVGRGAEDVEPKAKILQFMAEYRRDQMLRKNGLFTKFINSFLDMLETGVAPALMCWNYVKGKKDEPDFYSYPPEQVYPDFSAETTAEMRYCFFETFVSREKMIEDGYENIDEVQPATAPYNQVRAARNINFKDPLQNVVADTEYPSPGKYNDGSKDNRYGGKQKYRIMRSFYVKDGKVMTCVTSGDFRVHHVKETESPYGDRMPVMLGRCLPIAHKLVGEGFPEVEEGAQESFNDTINRRKDNVALFMNRGTIVSRFGNVDLQSLLNSRPGGYTLADSPDAVKEREMGDITQSAYIEANSESDMMQELSGVMDSTLGKMRNEKATSASINQAESSAKLDLFIAMIAETFMREFFSILVYMIQRFETDENIFRVANERYRQELAKDGKPMPPGGYIMDVDDFDADIIIQIGPGTVSRDIEIKNGVMLMDRMIQSNQAMTALAQTGAMPKGGLKYFDVSTFAAAELAPKIGYKNIDKYIVNVQPPPPQPAPGGAPGGQGSAPSPVQELLNGANGLQQGGLGG